MQKKCEAVIPVVFFVLCLLGSFFYILTTSSFGKVIVGVGGIVWLAVSVVFLILYLRKKGGAGAVCAIIMTLIQLPILYCWFGLTSVPIYLPKLYFSLSSAVGILIHLVILVLGVLTTRRMKHL